MFEEVKTGALSLTFEERAALVWLLLESLEADAETPEEDIAALWVQEAERRLEAVRQGTMRVYSAEERELLEEVWHRRVLSEGQGGETISFAEVKRQLGL